MDGGADDGDLEVIDLEPAARSTTGERPSESGVRRRRSPLVVAAIVVVGLVVSVVASRSRDHGRAASPSTTGAGKTVIRLHGGGLFPFRVGARVLTGGDDGLRVVDTDTGSFGVPNVVGLPAGPVTVVASSGGTVAVRVDGQMYWFTLREGMAHRVEADTAFAAADTGYVWLAGDRSATEVPGGPNRLHRARVETVSPALGATRRGLLERTPVGYAIQPVDGTSDAETFLSANATVVGVDADRVAWIATSDCGVLRCPVHVTEVASGATTTWIQLANHPDPIALADAVAYFAPDGGRVAIVVPDNSVTHATSMLIADLHAKRTRLVATTGYITAPARPGTNDGAGATVAWTGDGSYLVLAPAAGTGDGRLAVVDPATARVTTARIPLDLGASAGVIGESTLGALPRPSRPGPRTPIATDERPPRRPGVQLIAADDRGVDILDLGTDTMRSISVGGLEPNPAGPHSIARVRGGWLIVRGAIVDLIRDGATTAQFVDGGTQVFSANNGRSAWIASGQFGDWSVETYDPATGAIGRQLLAPNFVGVSDLGVVLQDNESDGTHLMLMDDAGHERAGPIVPHFVIEPIAIAGTNVLFAGPEGLQVVDLSTGKSQTLDGNDGGAGALSPDGTAAAWIETTKQTGSVFVRRLTDGVGAGFASRADRVVVADDGTVLAITGSTVAEGSTESGESTVYDGLSIAPDTEIALG